MTLRLPFVIYDHGLDTRNLGSSITNIKTLSSQYIAMFAVVLDLSFTAPHCCDCKTVTACLIESCNPELISEGNLTPQRCKVFRYLLEVKG